MRLKLQTTKSIFKPIEVEVDGKVYTCKKLTKTVLDKVFSFEELVRTKSDTEAPYKQANFAFNIPMQILHQLDAAEVGAINQLVLKYLFNPEELKEEEIEKNVKRPGDKG